MKRRDFMAAACVAGTLGWSNTQNSAAATPDKKRFLELRHYTFVSAAYQQRFDAFLAQAAIPAWNRLGIKPVGVFKQEAEKGTDLYVLLPHPNLESVTTANTLLLLDQDYVKAGQDVLGSPKKDPVYSRFESSLLLGFDACPGVEVPTKATSRLFQLRIYESHNTVKAKRKIEMFNRGGEIDLFRRVGLDPVFFGEALVGTKLPNLTYMLGFENAEKKQAAWDTFKKHPDWKKMSSDPYYKDTVSHITNLVLLPTAASQI